MESLFPHRTKIHLETLSDVYDFVKIVDSLETAVYLEDGENLRVNAKSIVGAIAALEWKELWCVSSDDIYSSIKKYAY